MTEQERRAKAIVKVSNLIVEHGYGKLTDICVSQAALLDEALEIMDRAKPALAVVTSMCKSQNFTLGEEAGRQLVEGFAEFTARARSTEGA